MSRAKTELLKGCTETMVLKLLGERAMYGYELVTEVTERSAGAFTVGQGTVYPLLYALERKGLIRAEWREPKTRGRRRKYYRLTRKGSSTAADRISEWKDFVAGMSRVLGIPHAAG
jgi:PadR family transcriptional regulator PadR